MRSIALYYIFGPLYILRGHLQYIETRVIKLKLELANGQEKCSRISSWKLFSGRFRHIRKESNKNWFFVQRTKSLGQLERTPNLYNSDTIHFVQDNFSIRSLLKSFKMPSKPSLTQKFEKNCVRLQPLI